MTKEALKKMAVQAIEKHRETIIKTAKSIWAEPEEGYREYKTAQKVEEIFADWGIPYEKGLAVTGIKGRLKGGQDGPTVCVMGELDAVCNPGHPDADPESGMVHACGHASQIAWLLGAGFGLKDLIASVSGNVVLFAVPAEEYLNLSFRQQLKDEGKIKYFGGKQELIRLGAFDDVDLALMCHAYSEDSGKSMFIPTSSNGFVGKSAKFLGRTSHAGFAPEKGINALNAFNVALSAIHAQRETFRDEDKVRVHPVLTKGGEGVNNVPSDVRTEMYVRAATVEAIRDANRKVDRALKAGAMGIGTQVEIVNTPGYLPLIQENILSDLWVSNSNALLGEEHVHFIGHSGASTDMGDVTHILPGIHPFSGGFHGMMHGSDFQVDDEEMAYLIPAKLYAMTVIDLLYDDAQAARRILQNVTPALSKDEYLALLDSFAYTQRWSEDE
ncbi:amidohydrolase [candidate division KSB3 bacterium]|uniref:Peptidase M20 domain-containing protein 2 n=1 Tax=candidate division KSB3 bacterium TaxID=2044937 RepID=A0A2G6E472_9BACT|nr:MAG: amidohydrolase [candidate division KSB3 bacterium]PIE29462.1 MAG: amidohydrolase [candidate division KSB3 bacterium]